MVAIATLTSSCVSASRFALRPPRLDEDDRRPFSPAPATNEEQEVTNALDVIVLGPIARAFLFEPSREALDVSSLDEVPDSSWFTNRDPSAEEVARGPCTGPPPRRPFRVVSSKLGGSTPGLVLEDADGQRYVVKADSLSHRGQPEINTAADAIVSRLYWAVGYNAPCNEVVAVRFEDLVLDDASYLRTPTGARTPLTEARLRAVFDEATEAGAGTRRFMFSRYIEGRPIGTWRGEGVREDDPNDRIPHQDRRSLRAERLLAAWVAHWDSRGPNTFDAFVGEGERGYVRHYFLDFGDALGATWLRTRWPEPCLGRATVSDLPSVLLDMFTFGLARRPWDDLRADPAYPDLGFFDEAHFDPMEFAPQIPERRWALAQPADLAWMARRIGALGPDHIRAAVRSGRLSDRAEEEHLIDVLLGRRRRILEASFAVVSPLTEVHVARGRVVCASDASVTSGIRRSDSLAYEASASPRRDGARSGLPVARTAGGHVCAELPPHLESRSAPDSAERYLTLDLVRVDESRRTTLRAHFYDLGARAGYVLVGVERL